MGRAQWSAKWFFERESSPASHWRRWRLARIATFPSTRSASTVGGVRNPSQATTYARSNFELSCGELLVEGPFSLAVSITVLHLLLRMLRSAALCSMKSGMASLSTVVKIGVSPSLLRTHILAKLQQLFHIGEKVSCSGVFPSLSCAFTFAPAGASRRTHSRLPAFPVRQTATQGGAGEVDAIRFLLAFIFGAFHTATVRSGSPNPSTRRGSDSREFWLRSGLGEAHPDSITVAGRPAVQVFGCSKNWQIGFLKGDPGKGKSENGRVFPTSPLSEALAVLSVSRDSSLRGYQRV